MMLNYIPVSIVGLLSSMVESAWMNIFITVVVCPQVNLNEILVSIWRKRVILSFLGIRKNELFEKFTEKKHTSVKFLIILQNHSLCKFIAFIGREIKICQGAFRRKLKGTDSDSSDEAVGPK